MWTSEVGLAYKISDTTISACVYKFQFYKYSNYIFFPIFSNYVSMHLSNNQPVAIKIWRLYRIEHNLNK